MSNPVSIVGKVESLWRYPVKSMRGEELKEAFIGFAGVYGDRVYSFRSSAAPEGFPYITGREQETMLLCRPKYRNPERMAMPTNLAAAEAIAPGLTHVPAFEADLGMDVETPGGAVFAIDDPGLTRMLSDGLRDKHELALMRSDRAQTDCRPISLFSVQTVSQLSRELGAQVDKRRFRANIYLALESGGGFGEDTFVGRTLRIGSKTTIAVIERDPRCKMITLDPDTAHANPEISRLVARSHDGKAGVYAAVLVEGAIHAGDPISLVN